MNQVESQLNALCGRRRSSGNLTLFGMLCLIAAMQLAGCNPSPASQALKSKDQAITELPAAAHDAEPQSDSSDPIIELEPEPERVVETPPAIEPPPVAAPQHPTPDPDPDHDPEEITTPADGQDLVLLGQTVPPGTTQRLMWSASEIFEGISTETPVLVVNGRQAGPTLCLTAAIHGDELNGIEMVRRVLHDLDPAELHGAVIGIPIVNLQGFRRGSRYLPDRRDLNRFFPGNPQGSSAARIAYSFFEKIILQCDALVDLHTGSFYRTNLPQLRADLSNPMVKELTQGFGNIVVLHSIAAPGTLRRAATDAGIPSVTLEAGEPLRLQAAKVSQGVNGVFNLLNTLEMVSRTPLPGDPEPVFYESAWVRANHGGILFSAVQLGQTVTTGDILGTITDPITNEQNLIYSPETGRILGMALNQVVMPGFAAYRIGIETDELPTDPATLSLEWDNNIESTTPGAAKKEPETLRNTSINDIEESSEE